MPKASCQSRAEKNRGLSNEDRRTEWYQREQHRSSLAQLRSFPFWVAAVLRAVPKPDIDHGESKEKESMSHFIYSA